MVILKRGKILTSFPCQEALFQNFSLCTSAQGKRNVKRIKIYNTYFVVLQTKGGLDVR